MRMAVVGVFALRVGVMHDQTQAGATCAERRPLQHLEIAVGVTESGNGTTTDMLIDADRLSCFVIDKIDLGQPEKRWCAILHFKTGLDRRSDDLFWRHAVDALGPWPHELDATARHNEGLEIIGA